MFDVDVCEVVIGKRNVRYVSVVLHVDVNGLLHHFAVHDGIEDLQCLMIIDVPVLLHLCDVVVSAYEAKVS